MLQQTSSSTRKVPMNVQFFIGGCSGGKNPPTVAVERPFGCPIEAHVRPVARKEFGTFTTSFGLIVDDTGLVIDNGTGIANVNQFFVGMKLGEMHVLQTHMHADHRSMMYANNALYKKGLVKGIYAPNLGGKSFQTFWNEDFDPDNWPVSPMIFGINHNLASFELGDTLPILGGIKTLRLNHPGGNRQSYTSGYSIPTAKGAIVIATDAELDTTAEQEAYAQFVSGARILYADVQYREREYAGASGICSGPPMSRKGWGHSTPEMLFKALSMCEKVPQQVVVGHHDTERTDEDLHAFELELWSLLSPLGTNVRLAREGDCFTL